MLTLYLIALIAGGTLLAASLLFGAHGDADLDAHALGAGELGGDAGVGHLELEGHAQSGDLAADVEVHGVDVWLPIASVRFWIFFAAFFGLSGTLLTAVVGWTDAVATALVSAAMGYLCGLGAATSVRWLLRHQADSSVRGSDLIGSHATVLLPVRSGQPGKVRISLKGQVLDALATTDDGDAEYGIGTTVTIYDTRADGELVVTQSDD